MKKYNTSLFIFRRDLRLEDNLGLQRAVESSERLIPVFIFSPEQIADHPWKSNPGLAFMCSSLRELARELRNAGSDLHVFEGSPHEVIARLADKHSVEAVFVNLDYTPYSRRRDEAIAGVSQDLGIVFEQVEDALLGSLASSLKGDGKPYTVFTPFFKHVSAMSPMAPVAFSPGASLLQGSVASGLGEVLSHLKLDFREEARLQGGRREGLALLKRAATLHDYGQIRDLPALDGTSLLSAHLKFGTVSAREAFWSIRQGVGAGHPLLRQLYWRDFFSLIAFHFPHVFGGAFRSKYDSLQWSDNQEGFARWCEGTTGFPIVDAGMRELNATGIMHNRVRMICGSFLVKDLHIDWREGEKYFARHLIDYDPAVNNGNWQWVASTGCDAQPYFRIFNPWLQQKRYDPDCAYIRKWLPELAEFSARQIHGLAGYDGLLTQAYPRPILDHDEEKCLAEEMFARV